MVRKELRFSSEAPVPASRLCSELKKLGYQWKKVQSGQGTYIYYDTQSGRLFKNKYRLRCHSEKNFWSLLQKGIAIVEQKTDSGEPPESGILADQMAGLIHDLRLIPHLRAKMNHQQYQLDGPGQCRLTMSVQTWNFMNPHQEMVGKKVQLLTVYTRTSPVEASNMATLLRDLFGFQTYTGDPLEAGLGLLRRPLPGAPIPAEYKVSTHDSIVTAGCKILKRQAFKMWANTEGTVADLDLEYLHDLRVATRRARFALRLLGPFLGRKSCDDLRRELSWIAALLGDVRDLDVFLELLDEQLDIVGVSCEVRERVMHFLQSKRIRALDKLQPALTNPRFEQIIHKLNSPGDEESIKTDSEKAPPAIALAPVFIGKALRKVCKAQGKPADQFTPDELHRMRILFKRLRYTCEFFSDFYGKEMKKAIKAFVRFQDCLGLHQDAYVAMDSLAHLAASMEEAKESSTDILLSLGALIQVQRDIARRQHEEFLKIWDEFPKCVKQLKKILTRKSRN